MTATIASAKLQGHRAAVLCLDVSWPQGCDNDDDTSSSLTSSSMSSSPLLLSGSEDGTARLWDLRDHRRRASLCIQVPGGGDVLSAVFAPPNPAGNVLLEAAETSIVSPFARDCSVYLGVENRVLEYDLRHAMSPILSSGPNKDWGQVLQHQDEVNQISLAYYNKPNDNNIGGCGKKKKTPRKKGGGNKKRQQQQQQSSDDAGAGGSLFLAACDDAGKARWTEAWSPMPDGDFSGSSTILHHDHLGVAVVPTCAFRPQQRHRTNKMGRIGSSLEIATGGTDCKIQLWDLLRPKRPISTFTIHQNDGDGQSNKPQVCNPPFVYSLAWSPDGGSLAAGLGDGTVGIFATDNRQLVQTRLLVGEEDAAHTDEDADDTGRMRYAHESSVASVVYPSFSVPTADRILSSAGSDGAIVFWDLGAPDDEQQWDADGGVAESSSGADAVGQMFSSGLLRQLRGSIACGGNKNNSSFHNPRILFDISHGQKINWVTPAVPSMSSGTAYNDTIFVADTSSDITSYTIPF